MTGPHLGSNFEGQGGPVINPERLFQNWFVGAFLGPQKTFVVVLVFVWGFWWIYIYMYIYMCV